MGTLNAGEQVSWTTVEAARAGAELFPPLYIDYYQSLHYQSLKLVPGSASLPGPAQLSPPPPQQDSNNNSTDISVQSSLSPLPPPRTPVRQRRAATPRSSPSQRVQSRRSQRKKTFSAIALSALTALSLYRPPPPTLIPSQSDSPASGKLGTPPRPAFSSHLACYSSQFPLVGPPALVPSSPSFLAQSPFRHFPCGWHRYSWPADPHHYNLEERDFLAWGYHEIKDQTGWFKSLSKAFLEKYPYRRRPPTPEGIKYIYKKLRKHKQLKDLPCCGRPTLLTDIKLAELTEEMNVDLHKPARYLKDKYYIDSLLVKLISTAIGWYRRVAIIAAA